MGNVLKMGKVRSGVQSRLEARQRGIGRLALGAHESTPHDVTQGDMGWIFLEAKEDISK